MLGVALVVHEGGRRIDELDHQIHVPTRRVVAVVTSESSGQPHRSGGAEGIVNRRFDLGAIPAGVSTWVELDGLGEHNEPVAVGLDATALVHEVDGHDVGVGRSTNGGADGTVVVVGGPPLGPPSIEGPVDRDQCAIVDHESRPDVSCPGIVEWLFEQGHRAPEQRLGVGHISGIDDHGHGFKQSSGEGNCPPGRSSLVERDRGVVGGAGEAHPRAGVRSPLWWHLPHAMVAKISATMASLVWGLRNAKRAQVSPSQPVGVTKAI